MAHPRLLHPFCKEGGLFFKEQGLGLLQTERAPVDLTLPKDWWFRLNRDGAHAGLDKPFS